MGPETHFSGTVRSVPSCCHGDLGILQPVVLGVELVKDREGGREGGWFSPSIFPKHPKSLSRDFAFILRKKTTY